MQHIQMHVLSAIRGGLAATMTQRNGVAGVVFPDENEFIPFTDLNYNSEYGYYRMSQFSDLQRDCTNENRENIHRGVGFSDGWHPYIWSDSGGNLTLLGDDYQVADLYQALKAFVERGELDPEEISEDDPSWDYMRGIDWAIDEALDFWLTRGKTLTRTQAGDTIRAAARRGAINGASQTANGKWYFNRPKFRGWLQKEENHKPGPKPKNIEDLLMSDPSTIQHALAAMTIETTGKIPRGQLWQPCEHPGCDNEPVCMNCMVCQEEHCHCFD